MIFMSLDKIVMKGEELMFPKGISRLQTEKLLFYIAKNAHCTVSYDKIVSREIGVSVKDEYKWDNFFIKKNLCMVHFKPIYAPNDSHQEKILGLKFTWDNRFEEHNSERKTDEVKKEMTRAVERYFF